MKTKPLRLFRNFRDLEYVEGSSVHTSPIESLRKHSGRIETCDEVVIHHFQYLKGGAHFLSRKQQLRLKGEIKHARQFPHEPYTYLNIAKTLFAERRDEEAVTYLSQALKLDRSFFEAHQLWGMIELQNGRFGSAEKHLRRATRVNANSADAWALLGIVLGESGKLRGGIRALNEAVRLHPHHVVARNSLGVLYEDLGMYEKARNHYEAAVKLHPGLRTARTNLARLRRTGERGSTARSRHRGPR